jgi:hypothetical protein
MSAFSEYVTSTAFHLRLSKVQIECLCQIHQLGHTWLLLTTFNALAGKGLVRRDMTAKADHPAGATVLLTDAGEAVMPLLKLAGLYHEMPKWPEPVDQPEIEIVVKRKTEPRVEA